MTDNQPRVVPTGDIGRVSDRTVHATNGLADVVRYDRSGKWYREVRGLPRIPLTVSEAVYQATLPGWIAYERLPGGKRFDALLRRRRAIIGDWVPS